MPAGLGRRKKAEEGRTLKGGPKKVSSEGVYARLFGVVARDPTSTTAMNAEEVNWN